MKSLPWANRFLELPIRIPIAGEKVALAKRFFGAFLKSCGLKSALHRYVFMLELIKYYYAYNSWATERVLASCEQLSVEEYNTPGCSGNGSIGETLSHLILVQQGWVAWFAGNMEMREAVAIMTKEKLATFDDARTRWALVDRQTKNYINTLPEDAVTAIRNFTRMNGKQESHPLWKLMMHTANHGTHTRAQIVAAIRRAGHAPQNIDLLNYVLNVP
jgi:uncharacterized damage-inducible protein DinB